MSGRQKRTIRKPKFADDDSESDAPASGPTIKGVTWALRSKVTAQDSEGQWYSARMIDIDEKNKTALIHFDRWNKRYDEWIPFGSPRVRPVEKPKAVATEITGKRGRGRLAAAKAAEAAVVAQQVADAAAAEATSAAAVAAVATADADAATAAANSPAAPIIPTPVQGPTSTKKRGGHRSKADSKSAVAAATNDPDAATTAATATAAAALVTSVAAASLLPTTTNTASAADGLAAEAASAAAASPLASAPAALAAAAPAATATPDAAAAVAAAAAAAAPPAKSHKAKSHKKKKSSTLSAATVAAIAAANAAAADAAAHLARLPPSGGSMSGQAYHGGQMMATDDIVRAGFAGAGAAAGAAGMAAAPSLSHGAGQSSSSGGDLRCGAPDCNKTFRKGSQLESHMRHYHPDLPAADPSTALRAGDDAAEPMGNPSKRMRYAGQPGDGEAMPIFEHQMPGGAGATAMELDPYRQGKRKRGHSPAEQGHPFESAQALADDESSPAAAAGLDEEENAVTKCICGFDDESDYMIQCERCNAWQHGDCVGVEENACPEKYLCYGCSKQTSKMERSMHKALWAAKTTKNPRALSTLPLLPKETVGEAHWCKKDTRTKHMLGLKEVADRERHRMLGELQQNMASDLAVLERCLRAIRLTLNERIPYGTAVSAKTRMEQLERRQITTECYIRTIIGDSEALESVASAFIVADKRKHGISSSAAPVDPMGFDKAIISLRQLYKKYDERLWKSYVEAPDGTRVVR